MALKILTKEAQLHSRYAQPRMTRVEAAQQIQITLQMPAKDVRESSAKRNASFIGRISKAS